jgi:hypothetical protein
MADQSLQDAVLQKESEGTLNLGGGAAPLEGATRTTSSGTTQVYTPEGTWVAKDQPSVITSDPAKNRTVNNQETLNQYQSNLNQSMNDIKTGLDLSKSGRYEKVFNGSFYDVIDKESGNKIGLNDFKNLKLNIDLIPIGKGQPASAGTEKTPLEQATEANPYANDLYKYYSQVDQNTQMYKDLLDNRSVQLDQATELMIENIKRTFDIREQQLLAQQEATLGGLSVAGQRSGRSRYAPEVQSSIVSKQEREYVMKLAELDVQELQLIQEAINANEDKQFAILDEKIKAIDQARQDKQTLVKDLWNISLQEQKNALDIKQDTRAQESFDIDRTFKLAEGYAPQIWNTIKDLPESASLQTIQDFAKQYNIDPNALMASVIEYEAKQNGDSIDFSTITSTDGSVYRVGFQDGQVVSRVKILGVSGKEVPLVDEDTFVQNAITEWEQTYSQSPSDATIQQFRDFYSQQANPTLNAGDYFTEANINKGAYAAGMTISEFKNLSVDEANKWIQEAGGEVQGLSDFLGTDSSGLQLNTPSQSGQSTDGAIQNFLKSFISKADTSGEAIGNRLAEAIGQFESGGNYAAIGPATKKGNKAYGKYQVMDFNIPNWTKDVLGVAMTVQQYVSNPGVQDMVAKKKIADLWSQYGNIKDVASVWFSGRPYAQARGNKDVIGTSVDKYVKNIESIFNNFG